MFNIKQTAIDDYGLLLVLGLFIIVVGSVNLMGEPGKVYLFKHRNVKEEDMPKYAKTVGTGTIIIGISLILAFLATFVSMALLPYILVPAVGVGAGLILYGIFRYNSGFF